MTAARMNTMVLAIAGSLGLGMVVQLDAQAGDRDKGKNDKAEVEGVVENMTGTCPNLQFTVQGKKVTTNSRTDFDDGACENIRNGQRVDVEGRKENGALVAKEVDLD